MTIDWGDLLPRTAERLDIERRLGAIALEAASTVSVRRCDSGYEATLRVLLEDATTEVRLQGADAYVALRRILALLEVVASERRRS